MKVTLRGIDDVNNLLTTVAPRHAYNIMRATVHGVAAEVRKDAKSNAPVDDGELQQAIKHKRERADRRKGYVWSTVRVNKRAFYWRFVEYGQGPDGWAQGFFLKAIEAMRQDIHQKFLVTFGKKWEAALARARKRNGR